MVNLTIVQPRVDPEPKTHQMIAVDLWDWGRNYLKPAIAKIEAGDTTEKAGSWCRWCIRKSECNAFASHKSSLAAEIFDDGVDFTDELE
jgi:CO dehydrogenase/acetyl-CoA synthase delta subunit